ncbi:MAG: hypothetical protein J6J27_01025 [Alphaproteobacteria bacterium]|nr:hypothetical protein [Alphaproteobacteria bacterium]
MKTLIIPCAGKSSRFPNMKPKWMLTHPDGKLMIEKAIEGINTNLFNQIIITILQEHIEKYEADLILKQVFEKNKKIKLCVLEKPTKSASETVFNTLKKMNIDGEFVVKDSDNFVNVEIPMENKNFVVGFDLHKHPKITNIPEKSFLIVNEQNITQDIIEKKIVSHIICLGIYGFNDAKLFMETFSYLSKNGIENELFISHIISYLLSQKKSVFEYIEASDYKDWGTLNEWILEQKKYRTFFIDFDGVIMKNSGKYGKINWSNNTESIPENVKQIINLQNDGGQIIITTSRGEEYRKNLEKILTDLGIKPYAILMGLNHSTRVLINDFAPTNPYPSSIAISLPRNSLIKDYLK